jgi:hypothetical protein
VEFVTYRSEKLLPQQLPQANIEMCPFARCARLQAQPLRNWLGKKPQLKNAINTPKNKDHFYQAVVKTRV